MSFYETYFNYQRKYTEERGEKAVVFIQKGTFYEAYSTETEGFHIDEIADIIKTTLTRSDKKKAGPPSRSNPNMIGIPVIKIATDLNYLTQEGYTVVLLDEEVISIKNGKKEIVRKVSGIYSPGTFIPDEKRAHDTKYILCAYIVEEPQLKTAEPLLAIGMTLVDIITGKSMVHEFYSKINDPNFGLDELFRNIQTYKPSECIIYYHPCLIDGNKIEKIKTYLELDGIQQFHFCLYHNKADNSKLKILFDKTFKIDYQNTYLSNTYNLADQMTVSKKTAIEIMNLERKPYAVISLIIMIRFFSRHNLDLRTNLSIPEIYVYEQHLILGNNAIDQLNVINSNNLESSNKKIVSLFDVVNKTFTPMGKRLLKANLSNPYSQKNKKFINTRYDNISELINDEELMDNLSVELRNIYDMERSHRKIANKTISPGEFHRLDKWYQTINRIIGLIKKKEFLMEHIHNSCIKKFCRFQTEYRKIFDLDEFPKYVNNNYTSVDKSFFHVGYNKKIDKIQYNIDHSLCIVNAIASKLSEMIVSGMTSSKTNNLVEIKHDDDGSYYFCITKTRERILKSKLEKKKTIKIEFIENDMSDSIIINASDIEFRQLKKGKTKIYISSIEACASDLHCQREMLTAILKDTFFEYISDCYQTYHSTLQKISTFIAEIDFLLSGALVAKQYYYCKPTIADLTCDGPSFLKATKLRHPIIERILTNVEYIPNDITLGAIDNKNGMLVYGLNFGGKCLAPDTKIVMYNGDIKMVKYIVIDDRLMGDDSKPRRVMNTCSGMDTMYKIEQKYGDDYTVNGPHVLCLMNEYNDIIEISVDDFLAQPMMAYQMYHMAIEYPEYHAIVDPYLYGCFVENTIPSCYLINSLHNRKRFLQGIIDTKCVNNKLANIVFAMYDTHLAYDILTLTRSLGYKCKYENHFIQIEMNNDGFYTTDFSITCIGSGPYNGFELDGNHRFVLADYTVTHNSSLMKSIGLAVILAQIGYYVPATEFVYEPYMAIYARINANDNILKGLSSFVLEMTELDAILKRIETNGSNTMVIGDEVCKGTESVSATALVASTLVQLSERNTSFIFSSHLHELAEIEEVTELKNLSFYHLNVAVNPENDELIFERKLLPGTGETNYGVRVAKSLIKNTNFTNLAERINNRLLGNDIGEFPTKNSRFNTKLVTDKCVICGYKPTKDYHKELEDHHINFQKDCYLDNKIKAKPHLTKNGLYNLVTLCRKCHTKVHKKLINIDSYKETTNGPKLFYTHVENEKSI